jgi:hypothetical protein
MKGGDVKIGIIEIEDESEVKVEVSIEFYDSCAIRVPITTAISA